jgi:hypothetical protein
MKPNKFFCMMDEPRGEGSGAPPHAEQVTGERMIQSTISWIKKEVIKIHVLP